MKKIFMLFFVFILLQMLAVFPASADPRMETNKNFCHFILDPDNTDNESFVAGCDSVITVVEKTVRAATVETKCEDCNCVASGYVKLIKVIPHTVVAVPPQTTLIFTSDDSDTPCTMVESNGKAYKSHNWTSKITVRRLRNNGLVRVEYELFCQDGQL